MPAETPAPQALAITGASGFVGRHLCALLQAMPAAPALVAPPRDEVDLLNPASLSRLCCTADGRPVDVVLHLASHAHVNQARPARMQAINVEGTRNLLQAAIAAGVPHLVYVSSILADPALDSPRTVYGESKWQAEQLLQQAHGSGDIAVTILRPANVYGVGMKGNLLTLLRLINARLLPPLPALPQPLSLLGVEDLCQALWLAASRAPPAQAAAPVYALSDGQDYTTKAVEAAIRQALGRRQPRWAMPAAALWLAAVGMEGVSRLLRLPNAPGLRNWHSLTRQHQVDITAARAHLGYNPRHTFDDALPALIATLSAP